MALIYITGMPSSGKSTILERLKQRDFTAYGGAEDNLAAFYNNQTGEKIDWVKAEDRTPAWNEQHTWKIPKAKIEEIKRTNAGNLAFICAVTKNDKTELWDLFDSVIALSIDAETLRHRLATRTNNDVGKTDHELEAIINRQKTAKDEYEQLGAHIVDATQPIDKVLEDILKIVQSSDQ
jgi:dephospho-CoA kinase